MLIPTKSCQRPPSEKKKVEEKEEMWVKTNILPQIEVLCLPLTPPQHLPGMDVKGLTAYKLDTVFSSEMVIQLWM